MHKTLLITATVIRWLIRDISNSTSIAIDQNVGNLSILYYGNEYIQELKAITVEKYPVSSLDPHCLSEP